MRKRKGDGSQNENSVCIERKIKTNRIDIVQRRPKTKRQREHVFVCRKELMSHFGRVTKPKQKRKDAEEKHSTVFKCK